jgi:prepilin-type N-terminal cleavage/methylation domain-containing protein
MKNKNGFSLVELSIVIVIIGLIIGGIVVGLSLIRTSRVQAVISDFTKYKQAALNFKDKYYYWPGDMPNADTYWGGCTVATASLGGTGCDGNGDGVYSDNAISSEGLRGFQFLALAGYIPGSYTGATTANPTVTLGSNVPKAPIPSMISGGVGAFYNLNSYIGSASTHPAFVIEDYTGNGTAGGAYEGTLTPDDAYSIDAKIDDGLPSSGTVVGYANAKTCVNGSAYYTGKASNSAYACAVSMYLDQ